ncbi:hypothetical protein GGR54DRAFT_635558 [Hypoxylon sp. NC1633]|nr:hypothetical protein GGR54DRAFT_635558 [Hypoxylon sp. NC1633]
MRTRQREGCWGFLSFLTLPPADGDIAQQCHRLQLMRQDDLLARAVNYLLDKEIEEKGLLGFECLSTLDIPSPSILMFHEKVRLVSKYHLVTYLWLPSLAPNPEQSRSPTPELGQSSSPTPEPEQPPSPTPNLE